VRFEPQGVECRVERGTTLFAAALEAGLLLQSFCGGEGKCGRCKVQVRRGHIRPPSHELVSPDDAEAGFCLACVTPVEDDLEVVIPPEMELGAGAAPGFLSTEAIWKLAAGLGAGTPDPWARWIQVWIDPREAPDAGSEAEAIGRALARAGGTEPVETPPPVLKALTRRIPDRTGEVWFLVEEDGGGTRVLDFRSDAPETTGCGLALDVGTTVVAGALIDLTDGRVLAESSLENHQAAHGADIIHRIRFAARKGGLERLQRLVLETAEAILDDLLSQSGLDRTSIVSVSAAGNTTMAHLFMGLDPRRIAEEPFVPLARRLETMDAGSVGLGVHPSARLWVSPAVANYLGGDITAGVLAAGVGRADQLSLYVDLGTNGEIVLGNREWMAGCACSCGPAFEGSGVGCGMRACAGAVDRVAVEPSTGHATYRVIGDTPPRGICGSGLVDLIAELRRAGLVDGKGKFTSAGSDRFRKVHGRRAFVVVPGEKSASAEDLFITERDLEHLLRSKGAAFAGVRTLLRSLEISVDQIQQVVIAGGFGRSLDIDHAIEIGMLPDLPRERFSYIGNGSLQGAGLALVSRELRDEVDEIARRITYVDLSTAPGYMDEFIAALFLPHTDLGLFPSTR